MACGDIVKIYGLQAAGHYNYEKAMIVGHKNGRWQVQLFKDNKELLVKPENLMRVDKKWLQTTSGSRFDQHAMLAHFAAPADRPPSFEARFESFVGPPCLMCTQAFWGFKCYSYMKEQLVTKLNARGKGSCSQALCAFREFGFGPAIVFSDGTKPTQSSLVNITAPWQSWWPVLAAKSSGGLVTYTFCQAQAVSLSMPWATHSSRVVFLYEEDFLPAEIPSTVVIEELGEEDLE